MARWRNKSSWSGQNSTSNQSTLSNPSASITASASASASAASTTSSSNAQSSPLLLPPVGERDPGAAMRLSQQNWVRRPPSSQKKLLPAYGTCRELARLLMKDGVLQKLMRPWTSVCFWLKRVQSQGGQVHLKICRNSRASVERTIGWASVFQLKVMESNHDHWRIEATSVVMKDWGHITATLYTLLVVDRATNMLIPAAFVLTSVNNKQTALDWIKWLYQKCKLRSKTFVTACTPGLFSAIRTIYPRSTVLFASSHVEENWSKKLARFTMTQPLTRKTISQSLNMMRTTKDYTQVMTIWEALKQSSPWGNSTDPKTSFIAWFEKVWMPPVVMDRWAAFNREDLMTIYADKEMDIWHEGLEATFLRPTQVFLADEVAYTLMSAVQRYIALAYYRMVIGTKGMTSDEMTRRSRAYSLSWTRVKDAVAGLDLAQGWARLRSFNDTIWYAGPQYRLELDGKALEVIGCECMDFAQRQPIPCKHMFVFERASGVFFARRSRPLAITMAAGYGLSGVNIGQQKASQQKANVIQCNCPKHRHLNKLYQSNQSAGSSTATMALSAKQQDKQKKEREDIDAASNMMVFGVQAEQAVALPLVYRVLSTLSLAKDECKSQWLARQRERYRVVTMARESLSAALSRLPTDVYEESKAQTFANVSDEQLKLLAEGMKRLADCMERVGSGTARL